MPVRLELRLPISDGGKPRNDRVRVVGVRNELLILSVRQRVNLDRWQKGLPQRI
jgi:hypothetical protein